MADVTNEQYAELKTQYDELMDKYNILEQRGKDFDATIAEKDERIKNLNDALYKATFTRTKEKEPEDTDDTPKDFTDLYLEALNDMTKKR